MAFTIEEQLLLSGFLPTPSSQARLPSLAPAIADWPALVIRAEKLLLSPLLRAQLAQTDLLKTLLEAARTRLETGHQVWAARHLAYVSEAQRLLRAFADNDVPALPLKGAALLLMNVYPQAGLRPALDLDILIEPTHIARAEQIAETCGYAVVSGRTAARPSQRLPNELNHTAPRRGANGLLLELHTRAFYFVQGQRAFGWNEMNERASFSEGLRLAASEDLALHLLHHTMVDWQSSQTILRTLADLHFLFAADDRTRARLRERAASFELQNTVTLAEAALHWLAASSQEEPSPNVALLLETALLPESRVVAEAARLFEYLDFSRRPTERLRALAALLFTNRTHLTQLYGDATFPAQNYWKRPLDLLRKFPWNSLRLESLRRMRRLRRLVHHKN
ncbi:MAG: hypothetical protein HOP19_02610 [Acidobacteria bacterium]|nr:hypothetical protein [Acidobacteriota bacterium]